MMCVCVNVFFFYREHSTRTNWLDSAMKTSSDNRYHTQTQRHKHASKTLLLSLSHTIANMKNPDYFFVL